MHAGHGRHDGRRHLEAAMNGPEPRNRATSADAPPAPAAEIRPAEAGEAVIARHRPGPRRRSARSGTQLTVREIEVLSWSALGKTSQDVAAILGISEGVVRIHLQSAQHKLDCLNRTHTVAKALSEGLIKPDLRSGGRRTPKE
jgi:DNA-binding CsgD family transcriptional regulator